MAVSDQKEVFQVLKEQERKLRDLGVRRWGLFGSFARGEQGKQSDVDILVEFLPGKKTFDNFMNLAFLLEEILGRKVDLVTPESLSPYIGPAILKEAQYATITP